MDNITAANYHEYASRSESNDYPTIQRRLKTVYVKSGEEIIALPGQSVQTFNKWDENNNTLRLLHASMGLGTEAGEFADDLKKHIFYGKELDPEHLKEELGDLLWYIGIAADVLGTSVQEIMRDNIAKLKKRYPEKFTEQDALERKDEA